MKIAYSIGSLELDKAEVKTLMSVADEDTTITIDLCKHLKGLDSKHLFDRAVEEKDPSLASIAAKLAMEGGKKFNPKRRRTYRQTGAKSVVSFFSS